MSAAARIPVRFSQDQIDAWAELSGDLNPLHVDRAYAETTRFGGTIAHGHLSLAMIEAMMLGLLGERWLTDGALQGVRFRAPVRPDHDYEVIAEPDGNVSWSIVLRPVGEPTPCVIGWASVREDT